MKKFAKLFLLLAMVLCFNQSSLAQSKKFDGVLSVELRNMGTIKEGDKVAGYYLFYKTDKGKKGFANFELQVMDPELNVVITKKMTEEKYIVLRSAVSNGEGLLFKFWDPKNKKVKFKGYNYSGETIITKSITISEKSELSMHEQGGAFMNVFGTVGVPGYGFVEYLPRKYGKMSYDVKYLPSSKTTRGWTKKGSSTEFATAQYLCAIDSVLINVINSRPKMMSMKGLKTIIQGINMKTGKKMFSENLKAKNYNVMILNGAPSVDNKNIVLYGLYYPPGEKVSKKSEGLIKIVMNTQGEIIEDFKLSWAKDFNVKDSDGDDFGNMHFHEFVYGEDGKTYLIAEQFGLNAGLTALSMALGGSGTAFKVRDILIIELTEDFKVDKIEVVEKSQNSYVAPGIPIASSQTLGFMADYFGWFDFAYLQNKDKPGNFTIGYVNFEKVKGSKNKLIFGGVTRTDGTYAYDKIPLSTKGVEVRIFQGKPGYVCLMEYTKKEKSLDLRLEKINF